MSKLKFTKYRPGFFNIFVILLILTGLTTGMDCGDMISDNSPERSCCCTDMATANSGSCEVDPFSPNNIDMPDNCPCVLPEPVEKPEAVAFAVNFDINVPTSTFNYQKESEKVYSSDFLSQSLHLQHSTKTYQFTEAYLN